MFKVVKNNNQNVLSQRGVDYLQIEKWSNTLEGAIVDCQAIIITTINVNWFNDIVLQLRMHGNKEVFLKPIFYKHEIKAESSIHTDGLFEENVTNEIVQSINNNIQNIPQLRNENDFEVSKRLVQFLYTRDAKLHPIKNRHSKIGYNYPFIGLYFTEKEFNIEKQLQDLIEDGVLSVSLKDKVQLCNTCNDSFLIYKETCPKCSSIDLQAQDIIHHFTCAHVAPQEQFINSKDDNLQCPKCDKYLRHIGIDYDKPSSIYNCNTCDHDFQIAQVLSECHSCDKVNTLEELIEVTIYDYHLTMKGVLLAEGKYLTNKKGSRDEKMIFYQLLEQEKGRRFAHGRSSYLATLKLTGELLKILDSNFINSFWKDIKQITKQYIINDLCHLKTPRSTFVSVL